MTTITLDVGTRDQLAVVRENLGYENWDDFLADLAQFAEDNMDLFDEAFPADEDEDEDEVEE